MVPPPSIPVRTHGPLSWTVPCRSDFPPSLFTSSSAVASLEGRAERVSVSS